jgi:sulfur-oxidizing protein SoxY
MAIPPTLAGAADRRSLLRQAALWSALTAAGLRPCIAAATAGRAGADELALAPGPIEDALRQLGAVKAAPGALRLEVDATVQEGARVPVTVESTLDAVSDIFLFVDVNPDPLVVRFALPAGTEPYVSTLIRMAGTGHVCAVVRSQGRLHAAWRRTEVAVGGCG